MPDTPMGSAARPACPECGYRDNYTFAEWWHCRGCGHSWRSGREPLWLRVTCWLLVAYAIVLLGVFVKWEAALIGCLIAVSVAVARG